MNDLDVNFDEKMSSLELEWRQAYDASLEARANLEAIACTTRVASKELSRARKRLDSADALKARVMAKIARLEDAMSGGP